MKTKKDFDALPVRTAVDIVKPKPASVFLQDYYQSLGDGSKEYLGIQTGLKPLDNATLGLDGLIVFGGIAGQGKTSLALQTSFGACELGTPVLYYSLEMPRRAILTKLFSNLARITYADLMLKGRGYMTGAYEEAHNYDPNSFLKALSHDEAERLQGARTRFEEQADKYYIRTKERGEAEITFKSVEQEIDILKAEHKTDKVFVVVDHLQVFRPDEYKDQLDKENKLITGFKEIVDNTGATIMTISQKNKAGFGGRGRLEEIKGSVDIVYLADLVMFLQDEEEKKDQNKGEYVVSAFNPNRLIELVISKNRYNAPTTLKLKFDGAYGLFTA